MYGLGITLGLGIFIVLGALIVFLTKNNKRFIQFSLSFAFAVMIMLMITDLVPEAYDVLTVAASSGQAIITILISAMIGFLILFMLDRFVPNHEDDPHTTKDDKNNLKHIGLVSSITLVIHNIIEGMAVSLLAATDVTASLVACIGIGLHNIPLGMVIASTFYQGNKDKKKTMMMILAISLSTFIGGLLVFLFRPATIPVALEGVTLSITTGMLLFIVLLELLPKVVRNIKQKATILGIVSGTVLLLISLFL